MKVALKGSLTKRVMCPRCKSELDYEPADVKTTFYEDGPIKWHVHCPLCEEKLGAGYSFVYVDEPGHSKKGTVGPDGSRLRSLLVETLTIAERWMPMVLTVGSADEIQAATRRVAEIRRELESL
jgi:hypothetical protein